jgi:hypothetical protein
MLRQSPSTGSCIISLVHGYLLRILGTEDGASSCATFVYNDDDVVIGEGVAAQIYLYSLHAQDTIRSSSWITITIERLQRVSPI